MGAALLHRGAGEQVHLARRVIGGDDDERPGPACYCGRFGCIETFLSGPALDNYYTEQSGEQLELREIMARARGKAWVLIWGLEWSPAQVKEIRRATTRIRTKAAAGGRMRRAMVLTAAKIAKTGAGCNSRMTK